MKDYRAIATRYRGYEFRSRLEAKYAVFFDLCGWRWSYEPPEFNGWIPDFAIGDSPTLVEVKPFYREEEFAEQVGKIRASGCAERVVLLGADPVWIAAEPDKTAGTGEVPVAWILEKDDTIWDLHFGLTEGNDKPGLCPMQGGWQNAVWNPATPGWRQIASKSGKAHRVWLIGADNVEHHLVGPWAEACNISKWMPQFQQGAA